MDIQIKENKYDIDLKDLIVMASRANNEKRNFLFVSKILGKHIEVSPDICRIIGYMLATLTCEKNAYTQEIIEAFKKQNDSYKEYFKTEYICKDRIAVLGFAETATGLGMAVASAIKDSVYLTTTRENIEDMKSILKFEEEHSHATTHKCYLEELSILKSKDRIILVDDEITTGKSMLNIIEELKVVTGINKYTILSVLDWRNEEYLEMYKQFKLEKNVDIDVLSLISGSIKNSDNIVYYDKDESTINERIEVIDISGDFNKKSHDTLEGKKENYLKDTGRFGVAYEDIVSIEENSRKAAKKIKKIIGEYKKVLILGHGENIYIPSRIASYMGGNVKFKTTTRSPIYCKDEEGYPILEKHSFDDRGVKYYFYNKSSIEKEYDKVVLIIETDLDIKLTNNIAIFRI
ncbi:phosphoribosyltransferase domain-containing protein [uncultured Clostridium sp.]|jgi:orotate phosphoribosyltransferase|uniref:phosphoribosyltransferase domain-containing protein n=1 Tax=uncultured Clostridium sp. TaxID=59620 RepID=UPI00262D0957|nr:phosphoribosyltransferase domain-containing protein [uncultured Clostridium sp.]